MSSFSERNLKNTPAPNDSILTNGYFGLAKVLGKIKDGHTLSEKDPNPTLIDSELEGPLIMGNGNILCDKCGNIIRGSYLTKHRSSGACDRNMQRKIKLMYNLC